MDTIEKAAILNYCIDSIAEKLQSVKETLAGLQESLLSETKSTAGDKHETGRAMVQLEMEKNGSKVLLLQEELEVLYRIQKDVAAHTVVRMGSMVVTNSGVYFIAISIGVVKLAENQIFVVSPQSPIGQLLLGKQPNDVVNFRNKNISINYIY